MSAYIIEDIRGSKRVDDSAFPLAIGGPDSDIQVDDPSETPTLGYLGLSEGELFVQPASDQYRVICNGSIIETSRWLHHGDTLRFGASEIAVEVRAKSTRLSVRDSKSDAATDPDKGTKPPLLVPPPREDGTVGSTATIEPIRFEPKNRIGSTGSRPRIRLFGLLAMVVLAALLVVAVFLLTSRSVLVEIEPAPDRLSLDGGFAFELGGRHLVRPGSYTLVAEKEGFSPLAAAMEVTRDTQQVFRFQLEKLPGLLHITSSVESAEVRIDGESRGLTPLDPLEVPPGDHTIEVVAERHLDYSARLTIEGGGVTQSLTAELSPRWAEVAFASEPHGARVRIDGEEVGKTPITVEVLDGNREIAFLLGGFKPYRSRITVEPGVALEVPAARLTPSDGNLLVSSEPSGATVSVGGVYRGETPLDLYLAPGPEQTIQVSMAGHEGQTQSIQVRSGATQELRFVLKAQEGEVQISAWPTDAELFIDDEPRGNATQSLRLNSVPHTLEIRKAGFEPHTQTLTPLPGVPQWIEVTLRPLAEVAAEAKTRATPPVTKSPDGQELRLIEPGKFRMGASRREPGRRSNEVLREVEISRPFYLATMEVANRQFRKFKAEHFSGQAGSYNLEIDHHPAVRMPWEEAAAYCNWLSSQDNLPPAYVDKGGFLVAAVPMTTGYRLPTEAEWTWAARYSEDGQRIKYPWGDSLPVAAGSGNFGDASAQSFLPSALTDYNDGFPSTAPVDSFAPNTRGIHNLGGNVAEWVHDLYAIRMGGSTLVERDPLGPTEGEFHVIRGSSWMHSTVTELRLSFRDYGSEPRPDVGFRVARYAK